MYGPVSREQIETLLLPLAATVLNLANASQRRVLVGVTGGAGSGKTVLSHLLCRTINALSNQEIAVPLSTDAYHYPNAVLDSQVRVADGIAHPLRRLKGLPPTFDTKAMAADLRRVRTSDEPAIPLPIYDRDQHDPVPGGLCVRSQHRVVIVEGLHLLRPEPEWHAARDCLDFCILLDLSLETCRRRVTERKIAAGRTLDDVLAHFERVDLPTLHAVQDPVHRAAADLVLLLEEEQGAAPLPQTRVSGCERCVNPHESLELREIPSGAVRLLAVGLNPALQKTLVFDHWERGQVNRAREILVSVGGKGQQFSRAASHLLPGMVTLVQFLGGENGDRIGRILENSRVNQITVAASGETRCCLTLIDRHAGDATELIEPSATIGPVESEQLLTRTLAALRRGDVQGLALCGTYPPGIDETFYIRLAQAKGNAILLLDSYRDVEAVLATGQVDILKVNAHELRSLAAGMCSDSRPTATKSQIPIPDAALTLFRLFQLRQLAVTAGPETAWLFERPQMDAGRGEHRVWKFYEFHLPTVEGVVNPIGAGDTVGAIFLSQLIAGAPPHVAFACGLAAGSASCRQWGGADFTLSDLHDILAKIRVSHRTHRWDGQRPSENAAPC